MAPRNCYHSNRSARCHGNRTKCVIASPVLGAVTLYLVCIALVRPNLEYCVQAWSPTYDCWLLERDQKRTTEVVRGISSIPHEYRLERLGMFSLR